MSNHCDMGMGCGRPAPFSPNREQYQRRMTDDDWRYLNARAPMQDWSRPPGEFELDAGYCLDRYSRIEFHGQPGYAGRR